jgi:hypothetical protein
VDVSIETCPHYLYFTEDDMERIGAAAKCAPPLRSDAEREELWKRVLDGSIGIIGSDHSPAPPEMKTSDDFFQIWGGIAGIEATLAVLLEEGHRKRGLTLESIAQRLATNPARRFGMAHKGRHGRRPHPGPRRRANRNGREVTAPSHQPLHRLPLAREGRAHVGARPRAGDRDRSLRPAG